MKLTRGCDHQMYPEFREVGGYRPGLFGRLLRLPIIKANLIKNPNKSNPNATIYCYIDFEDSPCEIGKQYHMNVAFGDELYCGITPTEHQHNNVYYCTISRIEIIRVEKGYESPKIYM